ncbi:MAG: M28 family peptidase, partial [bacterium]|nr:M28 family peptidase [bacterium]
LLETIGGPVAPEQWRGALPFTYHVGPGPAKVRLVADFDWTSKPFYNVVAVIRGAEFPDEWIIHGNHHDAWVNGARDPVSGAAALLETARALAELSKQGWKPRRTIVLALWDAEEFGLVGSTEWAEKHKADLVKKAVVYINTDSNGKGTLGTGGSPALREMMRGILTELKDPGADKTLLEAKLAKSKDEKPVFRLSALGAGSDYVAFFHHCGVSSLNLGFSGSDPGGIYHSIYDTPHWYRTFSDGEFLYSRTLSQVV